MKRELPDELMFIKNAKAEQKKSSADMTGKICIITGATSGVGLEAAKRLAKGGAHIVMVCRNTKKAEDISTEIKAAYHVPVDVVIADFSRLEDVRRAAGEILDRYAKIDVLINNAGMHSTSPLYTEEGYELVFCVDHLASFLLTNLLLDRLKESAPARIIDVNSEGHRFNGLDPDDLSWRRRHYTGLRGYGAAKTAQLLTVWEFADLLEGSGVTINAIHPGDVRTNVGSNNGPLYKWFLHHVTWHFLKDPVIAGEAIYYLAADPEMNGVSGRFFHLTIEEKPAPHARDRKMGKRIWELSRQMAGIIN
ncbi:SDR family NAD(P)-dependent oxidoreductase [Anaerobium acetethylicum]|uniref:NAD(P)-dependent dehydrogenase, short-chain alcohol dehydrogenase family n=1 Tax=Anaerobium acetethylicum TaxID=1619234 RepID=A0A1D3TWP7_9FIRM|nr:SDR family NAD(P)-dependent oxidoreductase [Anaerobium acetethylicum]SCP98676.1 NAD(P)-dependent dehydrogenase, short-chain alcohol dehydrogenase family [Anaerobium acetethylicum]